MFDMTLGLFAGEELRNNLLCTCFEGRGRTTICFLRIRR